MYYYSYEEFQKEIIPFTHKIQKEFNPDVLLAIARGGMTLGHFLAEGLNNRNLFSLNSIHYDDTQKLDTIKIFNIPDLSTYKKILLVDDIIDSGETMIEIKRILMEQYPHLELKVATVFYKSSALLIPDFYIKEATEWIKFFWSIEI
ncbi:phosphoribosyltransferase family protein [Campylobacter insulaenigrae]|uniref:Phosphoribosyltransferase n=1 Tax=Campylobacter insulaenigrae TaxID=260714 RepID=A0ABY3G4K0_9BACT|nr:phosphoribosyltransferase family protein [Campylobacter insulaenigrae]MCR6570518.1 phosphoribosyltransferase family protein [Campylobacter insulaenigrae]MCR6573773.1 phosphoribosyltransferase family protein [Campylobacter insulaenigrae]MCR6575535.1 phosphoribosyltransferase family protein [Campylobacter insulaenigrae]MCR6576729.1 phosphoribosyltransferase family protein [Campylobacter insulaenigrae]MCR6578091.1 phosphoribosyltransferase family protein [Campylobacter insulaenigrae]